MGKIPIAAGASSFDLVDVERLLKILDLDQGLTILDLACGRGLYAFELSKHLGESGIIYAVDLWEEGLKEIETRISGSAARKIKPLRADISKQIPLPDQSVDLCLMATVLHDLIQDSTADGTLREVHRVLKRDGRLAVVEFKVLDGPPGPPKSIRLPPERTAEILGTHGFTLATTSEVGPYAYLSVFKTPGP